MFVRDIIQSAGFKTARALLVFKKQMEIPVFLPPAVLWHPALHTEPQGEGQTSANGINAKNGLEEVDHDSHNIVTKRRFPPALFDMHFSLL